MDKELYPGHIEQLIAQRLRGTINCSDEQVLREWADSSPENRLLLDSLSNGEQMFSRVDKMREFNADAGWGRVEAAYRRRRLKRVSYAVTGAAAAVALIVGVSLYVPDYENHVKTYNSVAEVVDPSAVKLRLSGGDVYAVDSARRLELQPDVVAQSMPEQMELTAVGGAPVLNVAYSTLEIPAGKSFTVTLEDGSRVTLNAGSTLRFPERFNPHRPREVYLSGEAYFSVSKDTKRPFIVFTRESYVRVTGTEFNVTCYDDSDTQQTTLVSGSVKVGHNGMTTQTLLEPGMQALQRISTGEVKTYAVDTDEYTAWLQELFAFKDKPLGDIMQSVARWYGCSVVFENQACRSIRYTGKIARNSTLEQVTEFFRRTAEVNVSLMPGKIVIR